MEVAKLLVAAGANARITEGILGHTALHRCVDGVQLEVLTWLLADVGVDPNVVDLRGHSPAAMACTKVRIPTGCMLAALEIWRPMVDRCAV